MSENSGSGGIGFFGMVFAVLLTLKLAKVAPVAAWSWIWITSPLWIGIAVLLVIGISIDGMAGAFGMFGAITNWFSRRNRLKKFYKE